MTTTVVTADRATPAPAPSIRVDSEPPGSLLRLVRGPTATGPQPSASALAAALDGAAHDDVPVARGAALAAAKVDAYLRENIALNDASKGLTSSWFREVQRSAEANFHPNASDLDNPSEVSQSAIVGNALRDPTSWDEEAQRVLGPLMAAAALHSSDVVKRLPLSTTPTADRHDSKRRLEAINDQLRHKKSGLSVRFAFEVNVHHDGSGHVTAIDVLHAAFEKQLQEKVRIALDTALQTAPPAPTQLANGQPFRSRWVFVATWFIDPPGCMFRPSDSMGALPGEVQVSCGGGETSSFKVQQRVAAELVGVTPLVSAEVPGPIGQ